MIAGQQHGGRTPTLAATAVDATAMGRPVGRRVAQRSRPRLRAVVRAGPGQRVQVRHGSQLCRVLPERQEHVVPDPARPRGRSGCGRRGSPSWHRAELGLLHRAPQPRRRRVAGDRHRSRRLGADAVTRVGRLAGPPDLARGREPRKQVRLAYVVPRVRHLQARRQQRGPTARRRRPAPADARPLM